MIIYCNENVSVKTLEKDDWVVNSESQQVAIGIAAGCHTILVGNETDIIAPSLFAPTVEDAMRFILAFSAID
jgi:hypothetical protein